MFGYLRPQTRHGVGPLRRQQCALCHRFRLDYRQRTRMLAGYDPSTLLMLVEALVDELPERVQVRCPLPPFVRKRSAADLDWAPVQVVAAMQLLLAGEKLFDDRLDRDRLSARWIERALRRDIADAEALLRSQGLDVDGLRTHLRRQTELEQEPRAGLDRLSEPTARGIEAMARFALQSAQASTDDIAAGALFGERLGRMIYLVDALDDLEDDLHSGAFNPISHALGELTPRTLRFLADVFQGRSHALRSALAALHLRRHQRALDEIAVTGLIQRGQEALEQLPVGHSVRVLAGITGPSPAAATTGGNEP